MINFESLRQLHSLSSSRIVIRSGDRSFASSTFLLLIRLMVLRDSSLKTKQKQKRLFMKRSFIFLRKEVIQPHLPIRLPCYDFTPIICPTFGGWLQKVTSPTSGVTNSRGVTGGVYKARERIHRGMLIRDY